MPYPSNNNIQAGDTSSTTITLSNLVPARAHYSFLGWCSGTVTTSNGVDSCSTGAVIYNPNGDGTNLVYGIDQTTLNNATIYAMWKIDTFTCTKQYRLQNADGTYPDAYTADGSETINYGDTCTYTKIITDYQGDTGNDTARSANQSITADTTLSLDFPRNTYALTITKNDAYIDSITGAGTYRWGQSVSISATASSGNEFTAWSQTAGTTGTFGSTTNRSTTFTMGKGAATIYANGKAGCTALPSGTGIMQTYTITASALANVCVGSSTTLKDNRDNQSYKVAKLADGKLWMTENLNIAGGTALSADNTDVTSAYISSFTTSNNLTKTGNTIVLPASSTSGFSASLYSYVYNSGNKTNCGASGQNTPCYSYYSWDAATLGSGRSISSLAADAPYSICPKGWKLPTTRTGTDSSSDFRALMIGYGGSASIVKYNYSTSPTGDTMYGKIGPGTTPNFLLAGYYHDDSFSDGGSYGHYWSATSYGSAEARRLRFTSAGSGGYVNSADNYYRCVGSSVRCLLSL